MYTEERREIMWQCDAILPLRKRHKFPKFIVSFKLKFPNSIATNNFHLSILLH